MRTVKNKAEAKDFINLGIVVNKDKVLMIRRVEEEVGKDNSTLKWAFPGGKQHYDETREKCVKREILAETGYEVIPTKQLSLRIHPQFPVTVVYHLCRLASPKPAAEPREPHEIAEIKWIEIKDVPGLISTDLDRNVKKALGIK